MYKGLSSTKVPHLPLSYNTAISSHDRPLLTHFNNTKCQSGQYMGHVIFKYKSEVPAL